MELSAIGYIGIADPARAEKHLWRIYQDETADIHDRARAFELFWRCPSDRAREEPKEVLVDETQPWPLRRAAAINLLWSERDEETEELLAIGLRDPRQEVRLEVIDAIVRFELEQLSPDLMQAYEKDRSRKGKAKIKWALRHFNSRAGCCGVRETEKFRKCLLYAAALYRRLGRTSRGLEMSLGQRISYSITLKCDITRVLLASPKISPYSKLDALYTIWQLLWQD